MRFDISSCNLSQREHKHLDHVTYSRLSSVPPGDSPSTEHPYGDCRCRPTTIIDGQSIQCASSCVLDAWQTQICSALATQIGRQQNWSITYEPERWSHDDRARLAAIGQRHSDRQGSLHHWTCVLECRRYPSFLCWISRSIEHRRSNRHCGSMCSWSQDELNINQQQLGVCADLSEWKRSIRDLASATCAHPPSMDTSGRSELWHCICGPIYCQESKHTSDGGLTRHRIQPASPRNDPFCRLSAEYLWRSVPTAVLRQSTTVTMEAEQLRRPRPVVRHWKWSPWRTVAAVPQWRHRPGRRDIREQFHHE